VSPSHVLHGIGVSRGLAAGPALVLRRDMPTVEHRVVPLDQVDGEVVRLHDAVDSVRRGLEDLRARARERVGPEEAKIFDAQILMLQDEDFLHAVERLIRDNQLSAARAFEFRALEIRALWANSGSNQLRERVADLSGLQLRVLHDLIGEPADDVPKPADDRPVVVFTRELTPGLTVQFEREHVAGFVSEEGTRTAHAAILARSLGIPCVMGLSGALTVESGTEVIIDGAQGTVMVNPSRSEIASALAANEQRRGLLLELESSDGRPTVTSDHVRVQLRGNLDLPEELDPLAEMGAEGVGLLRTEFLVVGRADLPSETEQLDYFRNVLRRLPDAPLIVRSYDVGGDKFPAAFRIMPEPNPFLGWRAIRVCLDNPALFLTQIRALLRARIDGDVQLMLPLVVDLSEVRQTRELIAEAKESLAADGLRAAADLPLGVMVETPAAALNADLFAAECDFLSVGTNDLTQYMLAVDRANARLADRFQTLHPAMVRTLQRVREAARNAGTPISVCGELASEPLGSFLLLGLGYDVFSVSPSALPLIRWFVRQVNVAGAQQAVEEVLEADSAATVAKVLETHLAKQIDLSGPNAGWLLPPGRPRTTFK